MKKLLFLFVLLPFFCAAQQYPPGKLAENRVDEATHDTIMRTSWQVLERAGVSRKLNTYYRFSHINNSYFLDLKITQGGEQFVVARNAELKLMLEGGDILTLYNSRYEISCQGCGARGYGGNEAQGVLLSFALNKQAIHALLRNYIAMIGINTGEDYLEKPITDTHSELFVDELQYITNR